MNVRTHNEPTEGTFRRFLSRFLSKRAVARRARGALGVMLVVVLSVGTVALSPTKAVAAPPVAVRTALPSGQTAYGLTVDFGTTIVWDNLRSSDSGATWNADAALAADSYWDFVGGGTMVRYFDSGTASTEVVYTPSSGAVTTRTVPQSPMSVNATYATYIGETLLNTTTMVSRPLTLPTGAAGVSGLSTELTAANGLLWHGSDATNAWVAATPNVDFAPSAWVNISAARESALLDNDFVYLLADTSAVTLCRRPLANFTTAPTCLTVANGNYSSGYVFSLTHMGSLALVSLYNIATGATKPYIASASSVAAVQLPVGSQLQNGFSGGAPYLVVRDSNTIPSVKKINLDGSLGAGFAIPNTRLIRPYHLAVTPDRVVGGDPRDGSQSVPVWTRSVSSSAFGSETLLPNRASGLAASAGRTLIAGKDGVTVFDRNVLQHTYSDAATVQDAKLSGPYVYEYLTDGSTKASKADGSQSQVITGWPLAVFASQYVSYQLDPSHGSMHVIVGDLNGTPTSSYTLPVGTADCIVDGVWGSEIALGCWTGPLANTSRVYDYKSGALIGYTQDNIEAVGDGYAGGDDYGQYAVWNFGTGAYTALTNCPSVNTAVATDGIGHVVCTSDAELMWWDFSSIATSAPRLLGVLAAKSVDFTKVSTWVPDIDTTKPLNAGTLVIKNGSGQAVRTFATPATTDGSIRGISWDGKNASGDPVLPGTYTYTLTASATDGTGAVVALDGVSAASGPLTVAGNVLVYDQFVKAAYQDFLGRQPSPSELSAKTTALVAGSLTKESFLTSMANSDEWLNAIVTKMYVDTLGRQPDAAGLAGWTGFLRNKTFTVADVASRFYASDEYYLYHAGGTPTSWVTTLYQKLLGRSPDAAGLAQWVAYTTSPSWGRTRVAYEFYQSTESRLKRVEALYQVLLGREPDSTGWPFWADVVRSTGDITLAVSLANSEEYWLRAKARY